MKRKRVNKRFIPNIFTIVNMFFGFLAIISLVTGEPQRAVWFVFFAATLDAFDGKLARILGIESEFGAEFDSFADTISFCVAPALLIYMTWVDGLNPLIGAIISFIPIFFGTIRLAKFNLLHDDVPKSYMTGLTTPLYALTLFGFFLFANKKFGTSGDPRIALALAFGLGFLMLSPVKFGKVPMLSTKLGIQNNFRLVLVGFTLISIIIWKGLVLFPIMLAYIIWSILNWIIYPNRYETIKSVQEEGSVQ